MDDGAAAGRGRGREKRAIIFEARCGGRKCWAESGPISRTTKSPALRPGFFNLMAINVTASLMVSLRPPRVFWTLPVACSRCFGFELGIAVTCRDFLTFLAVRRASMRSLFMVSRWVGGGLTREPCRGFQRERETSAASAPRLVTLLVRLRGSRRSRASVDRSRRSDRDQHVVITRIRVDGDDLGRHRIEVNVSSELVAARYRYVEMSRRPCAS